MFKIIQVGLFALLLLVSVSPAQGQMAQGREENPIQIQYNGISGGTVLGVHVTKSIYVGYFQNNPYSKVSESPTLGKSILDPLGGPRADGPYGDGGLESYSESFAAQKALELRYSEGEFGLYISVGYIKIAKESSTYTYDQRQRGVGDNQYDTGYSIATEKSAYKSLAFGVGFNHVTKMGFSLGTGLLIGTQEREETQTITGFDSSVTEADKALFKESISGNYPGDAFMTYMSIGWNF
ncbi:MAG: hypothetical protein QNL04_08970 [SAR324 cluster bacterium]|nr:hypothetical protein [SAR324 cluster bacterium]